MTLTCTLVATLGFRLVHVNTQIKLWTTVSALCLCSQAVSFSLFANVYKDKSIPHNP